MTVAVNSGKAGPYTGDGANARFPFLFEVLSSEHLAVYKEGVKLLSGFTVELVDEGVGGGTVVMNAAPAAGERLAIIRDVPIEQPIDLQNGTAFYPEVLEAGYDRIVMICQQLKEAMSRALIVPPTSEAADGMTPEALLEELAAAVEEVKASGDAAVQAAAQAALAKSGVLTYEIPESVGSLTFEIEIADEGTFTAPTQVNTSDDAGSFAVLKDGVFEAVPVGGFDATYAGLPLFAFIEPLDLDAGTYYLRSRWNDGSSVSDWEGTVYIVPEAVDPAPVTALEVSDLPVFISGLELAASAGDLVLAPGRASDSTDTVILKSTEALTLDQVLAENTRYSAYLITKADGSLPLVWASAGMPVFDVAWVSPQMFADDYPANYAAAASSLYTGYQAYRAFDRDVSTDVTRGWAAQAGSSLPQHVQLTFDSEKKIAAVTVRNRNSGNRSRGIKIYALNESVWAEVPGATAELANLANSQQEITFASPVNCFGIRVEVTSVWSGTYAALAEVVINGFASRPNDAIPLTLPATYAYFRKVGEFDTDSSGELVETSVRPIQPQRIGAMSGRVWLSEPQMFKANTTIAIAHGLAIDPFMAKADLLFECVAADGGYSPGDFAVNVVGGDYRLPLTPALDATNVTVRFNDLLTSHRADTGARFTMNKDCWAVHVRVIY